MPMGFAAILGGTLTLVASGPLILLNDLLASSADNLDVEVEPFGLFAPTPIGARAAGGGHRAVRARGSVAAAGGRDGPQRGRRPARTSPPATASTASCTRRWSPPTARSVGRDRRGGRGEPRRPDRRAGAPDGGPGARPPTRARSSAGASLGLTGPTERGRALRSTDQGLQPLARRRDPFARSSTRPRPASSRSPCGRARRRRRAGRDLRLRVRFGAALLAVHHRGEVVTEGCGSTASGPGTCWCSSALGADARRGCRPVLRS
jgi:hypothetical protein